MTDNPSNAELLECVTELVNQYALITADGLSSGGIGAMADALRLLARGKIMTLSENRGRFVTASWSGQTQKHD